MPLRTTGDKLTNETRVQELIDSSLAGFGQESNTITTWDTVGDKITKVISDNTTLPKDKADLVFATITSDLPDGIYEFQIQISGDVKAGTNAGNSDRMVWAFESSTANQSYFARYTSIRLLKGDYSTQNAVIAMIIQKVSGNYRVYFPTRGVLPAHINSAEDAEWSSPFTLKGNQKIFLVPYLQAGGVITAKKIGLKYTSV